MTKVGSFALFSRILVIVVQAIFNFLMPDHDAKVFLPPVVDKERRLADAVVEFFFSGFRRWDGVYFLHIAEYGYTYENTLAFFPVFPMAVRLIANTMLLPMQWWMNYRNVLLLSAVVFNLVLFVQSAKILHQLSLRLLGDSVLAYKAVQLYCVNPASIFFSAAYSETLFSFLTVSGLLKLEDGHFFSAAVCFGLSGGTRSNGLVNMGFIVYRRVEDMIRALTSLKRTNFTESNFRTMAVGAASVVCFTLWSTLLFIATAFVPFVVNQFQAYWIFCNKHASAKDLPAHIVNYGNEQHYKMAHTGLSAWCHSTPPFSYSYVQSHHWDVGFLKYYEVKQIPNFLLGAPIVFICVSLAVAYFLRNPLVSLSLGFYEPPFDSSRYKKTDDRLEQNPRYGVFSRRCFVHVAHLIFLVAFGLCFMHVQVLTRLLASACPVLYFYLATITTPKDRLRPISGQRNSYDIFGGQHGDEFIGEEDAESSPSVGLVDWDESWVNRALSLYFHLYFFVGIGAFANFLPWT